MPFSFKNNWNTHKNKLLAQFYKEVTATTPSATKGEEVYTARPQSCSTHAAWRAPSAYPGHLFFLVEACDTKQKKYQDNEIQKTHT